MTLHRILHRPCILIQDAHSNIILWNLLMKRRKAESIWAERMTGKSEVAKFVFNCSNIFVSSWKIAAIEGENKLIALQMARVGKIFFFFFFKSINSILEKCHLQLAFPVLSADYLVYQRTATRMNISAIQLKSKGRERGHVLNPLFA